MPPRTTRSLKALRVPAARQAYDTFAADLEEWPANGYSLWGLHASMLAQPGKYAPTEVAAVGARMAAAWRVADVPLVSSCAHFDEPSRAQP